jgi:flagellar protein FliS
MSAAALARYKSVQITTSSPGAILVMLFEGLLRFLGEAATAMRAGDRGRAGEVISRAHAILDELAATLDPGPAPELVDNLRGIYSFCMTRIVEANAKQDPRMLDDAARILQPISDAFRAAAAQAL